jgi:hypothetical protein
MEKMFQIKCGAIIKVVPENTLKYYVKWKVLKEVVKNDKTDTKKNASK